MKRLLKNLAVRRAMAWLIARALTLLLRSIRWQIAGDDAVAALVSGPPCIVALWHESLPVVPVLWLHVRKLGMTRRTMVLASKNSDGQLAGLTMTFLGAELMSGSSRHGGKEAYEGLVAALEAGAHVVLTPDGPRGPRRHARPGVALLAARTGVPVLPIGVASWPVIQLNSWDSMRLPLPFSRGVVRLGAPVTVPADDWEAGLHQIEASLSKTLDDAMALCRR
jgi:lysophospholipid acyltransferase (LPLAT)-like uncharacterized protein